MSARVTEMASFLNLLRAVVPELARDIKLDDVPPEVLSQCLALHRMMRENGDRHILAAEIIGDLETTMRALCTALAVLSLQPGGVDLFGLHFESGEVTES